MAHLDLANRLAIYGWKQELEDFDRLLAKVWWEGEAHYAHIFITVEMMLHHCTKARNFCDDVRRQANLWIEDYEILLRLTNIRKNNFLASCEPEKK
jgi:hypothetical protein